MYTISIRDETEQLGEIAPLITTSAPIKYIDLVV